VSHPRVGPIAHEIGRRVNGYLLGGNGRQGGAMLSKERPPPAVGGSTIALFGNLRAIMVCRSPAYRICPKGYEAEASSSGHRRRDGESSPSVSRGVGGGGVKMNSIHEWLQCWVVTVAISDDKCSLIGY